MVKQIGRLQDETVRRVKLIQGQLAQPTLDETLNFLIDFYETFKARGAMEVFRENADKIKEAIKILAPEPALRRVQMKSIRQALDELERGK